MTSKSRNYHTDELIVEAWLKGWSLTRGLPLPVKDSGGLRVDVGWPQQQVRYVFSALTEGYLRLATTISDPWVFLKVCAAPEAVQPFLPDRWVIQPPAFMMTFTGTMIADYAALPGGYVLEADKNIPVSVVKIYAPDGKEAAIGRVGFVDQYAIYDRVETHPDHRRRGLGSLIMKNLEAIGMERGIKKGVLVATPKGRLLYEKLGWTVLTPYTTAVIPG